MKPTSKDLSKVSLFLIAFLLGSNLSAGTVVGKVTLSPANVKSETVKMSGDATCVQLNQGKTVLRDEIVVGSNGTLKNVVVYVKEGLKGAPPSSGKLDDRTLDQHGCMYSPKVTALRVGQNLKIRNSDTTAHNIRGKGTANPAFNLQTQRAMELPKPVVFAKPELGIRLKCDYHGWMLAYIHVFDHPYFAVTDDGGNFRIENLPAGEYVLEARHESGRIGAKVTKVSVKDTAEAKVDFNFSLSAN